MRSVSVLFGAATHNTTLRPNCYEICGDYAGFAQANLAEQHPGVQAMFMLGLAHGTFSLFQFHALGNVNPLVSLFVSNTRYNSVADFPFQALGFFALLILFLLAATSHDFGTAT